MSIQSKFLVTNITRNMCREKRYAKKLNSLQRGRPRACGSGQIMSLEGKRWCSCSAYRHPYSLYPSLSPSFFETDSTDMKMFVFFLHCSHLEGRDDAYICLVPRFVSACSRRPSPEHLLSYERLKREES